MKILNLGEALVDVVHSHNVTAEHVGGSLLNVGCGLARLGHDATVAAWFGRDERGQRLVDYANEAGAKIWPGSDGAEKTTVAFAEIDDAGKATYTFDMTWDVPPIDVAEFGHIHTGSIGATLEPGGTKVVEVVTAATGTVSYDPNVRPALMISPEACLPRIEAIVAKSDVVKASDDDLMWLYPDKTMEEIASAWIGMGLAMMVITRGAKGASVRLGAWEGFHDEPTIGIPVIDTVGAGDSFMAGLISGLVELGFLGSAEAKARLRQATWHAIAPAVKRAIATSTITVSKAGAYGPTTPEVDELLRQFKK